MSLGAVVPTVFLLHFDGNLTDSSSVVVQVSSAGNSVLSTTGAKFGTGAFYTPGTVGNYYASVNSKNLIFGTSNFTIDFWMNPSAPLTTQRLFGNLSGTYATNNFGCGFNSGAGGLFHWDIYNSGTLTAITPQVAGTYYHIALVKTSVGYYFYQNGILQSSLLSTASFDGGVKSQINIGWSGYSLTAASEYYNGYLDEFRIVIGSALFYSNFTPPTTPYNAIVQLVSKVVGGSSSFTGKSIVNQISQLPMSAFSLIALNGITAKAVNVTKGSGGVAQDFYADRKGNLLTVAITGISLAAWLNGSIGYVAIWYDQSGNGNHVSQATAASQPYVSLLTTPASIVFSGAQQLTCITAGFLPLGLSPYTTLCKVGPIPLGSTGAIYAAGTYTTAGGIHGLRMSSPYLQEYYSGGNSQFGTLPTTTTSIFSTTCDTTAVSCYQTNLGALAVFTNPYSSGPINVLSAAQTIGNGVNGGYFTGNLYSLLFFTSVIPVATRVLIETNI